MLSGEFTLTPRMKSVIQAAEQYARDNGHDFIGTEHMLVALANEPAGIAGQVLDALGVRARIPGEVEAVMRSDGYGAEDPHPLGD